MYATSSTAGVSQVRLLLPPSPHLLVPATCLPCASSFFLFSGIFFKFDLDSLALTIRERTTSFYHFLIRLVGVIGGVWTCTGFALRAIARAERELIRNKKGKGRAGLMRGDDGGILSNGPGAGVRRASGMAGLGGGGF